MTLLDLTADELAGQPADTWGAKAMLDGQEVGRIYLTRIGDYLYGHSWRVDTPDTRVAAALLLRARRRAKGQKVAIHFPPEGSGTFAFFRRHGFKPHSIIFTKEIN